MTTKKNRKLDPDDYEMISVEDENHACYETDLMEVEFCDTENPECKSKY